METESMTAIAIGTLGTNDYMEVKYRFPDGQTIASSYPIHALIQREQVKIDQTIILLTEAARARNWEMLELYLKDHTSAAQIRGIPIKDGANESELWDIFEAITQAVPEDAELYIDITHGLRHLPMLLIMACAYLRTAKNVAIRSISYGAFELGKKEKRTIDGRERDIVVECEIFELLPFVALFDWANATSAMQRTGDAGFLAHLLRQTGNGLPSEAGAQLEKVASRLDQVTLALDLNRPEEAMWEAQALRSELKAGTPHLRQFAKPFSLLSELIDTTFTKISLPPARIKSLGERLDAQRRMINWYMQRGRVVLASLLAREWVISRFMQAQGESDVSGWKKRCEASESLNRRPGQPATPTEKALHQVWIRHGLAHMRNEIAHAGQSGTQPVPADQIKQRLEAALKELDKLGTEDL
jgi:CRISPR-associated Csx2 family protein